MSRPMFRLMAPVAALALLAACQQAEAPAAPAETPAAPAEPAPAPTPAPAPEPTPEAPGAQPVSCLDERGEAAAQALADQCRQVSPATRPPCNVANPCAMIQDEIDRACALWAEDGDVPAECAA